MRVLRDGSIFDIISDVDIIDELPLGNYELKFGAFGRIFLRKTDDIILPEKVYSNDTDFIEHVLYTWEKEGNLGIGLVGGKGLGKSFTGNMIANKANVPVIRITGVAPQADLFGFLNKIEQDFVLFIDEFEKNFSTRRDNESGLISQEDFLTFLDNGAEKKNNILLIITANNQHALNDYLKNRPSRLRYYRQYLKLEDSIIKEIVNDLLKNLEYREDLLKHLPYEDLNIDVLIKIIQEINLHDKPYSTFKNFFNYNKESYSSYDIFIEKGEELVKIPGKITERTYISEDSNIGKFEGSNLYTGEIVDFDDLQPSYKAYTRTATPSAEGGLGIKIIEHKIVFKDSVSKYDFIF